MIPLEFPVLSNSDFLRIRDFMAAYCGIKLSDEKKLMLESRLAKRTRALGIQDFKTYLDYIFLKPGNETELANMVDVITTNKTDFFREIDHFQFLRASIIPAYHERDRRVPFLCWSAGCSSGEEVYSIAMELKNYQELHPGFDFHLHGTDISYRMVEKAILAVYEEKLTEDIPLDFKHKYLMRSKKIDAKLFRIVPEIREKVSFAQENLYQNAYPEKAPFDLIFCRNVLIYFSKEVVYQVLNKLVNCLKPGGYLFTGHSESIIGIKLPIRQLAPAIYQKT